MGCIPVNSFLKKAVLTVFCLSLAGCATGYHKLTSEGGYTDTRLQDDIFKVEFIGNSYVGPGKVEDFTLLRSAEVCIENGYNYFVILAARASMETDIFTTPQTIYTHGSVHDGSFNSTTYVTGGQTYLYQAPSTRNIIKCFKEKPANIPTIIYDARQIRGNLARQYGLDTQKTNK